MPDSALPENLRGRKHEDWIWPLNKISRGLTAFKWRMPPKLIIGYNVKTWETAAAKDTNTVEYPFGKGLVTWKDKIKVAGAVDYGPSTIQKILGQWKISCHLSWPLGFHVAAKLWKKKKPGKEDIKPNAVERGYDQTVIFYFRIGARWDSYDAYYQFPGFFIGLTYN